MRITASQRAANENRIRAAMDRLLRGEIPPGRCDITTLVVEAGVNRTAFYGTRPHADLRASSNAAYGPSSRLAISPTRATRRSPASRPRFTGLKNRVVESTSTINQLTEFQTQALARLAAQHDEIIRLRAAATSASRVSRLPQRAATIGSCNSPSGQADSEAASVFGQGRGRPRYDGKRQPVILS